MPETGAKRRGIIWVPCRVGGYPGKTRFLGRLLEQVGGGGVLSMYEHGTVENSFLGRLWVQVGVGGGVLTMYEHGYDPSVA